MTRGFVLLEGPHEPSLRARAKDLARESLGGVAEKGHPDWHEADLLADPVEVGGTKFHPKWLRWWTDPPTKMFSLFALPPRRGGAVVLLLHGLDLLAFADTRKTIQNRLLKPLEELPPSHLVVATATRPHLVLPTILSRARRERVPPPQGAMDPDPALAAAAGRWLADASGSPGERLAAAALLAPGPWSDREAEEEWWAEAGAAPAVAGLYGAVQAELAARGAEGDRAAPRQARRLAAWHAEAEETNANAALQLAAVLLSLSS